MENQKFKEELLEEENNQEKNEEVVEEKELSEEEKEKIAEEKRIREEFDAEEGIEFVQTITKEDAFNFNVYLLNNPSNFTRRMFTAIFGLILIIYILFIKEMYWVIAIGVLMIIHAIFVYGPLQKLLTRRMFKKREFKDLNISVKFASKMKYELIEEESAPLIDYDIVYKVVETKDYIFLHIDTYSIMIIKLTDCPNKEELVKFLQNKFEGTKKYKIK